MSHKRNVFVSDCILGQPQIRQHNTVITAVVINETMLNIISRFMLVLLSCFKVFTAFVTIYKAYCRVWIAAYTLWLGAL